MRNKNDVLQRGMALYPNFEVWVTMFFNAQLSNYINKYIVYKINICLSHNILQYSVLS